ncbi:MAG TPA: hypothetical protein VIX80_11010 [Candidatus Kapabacteria bacterium]
MQKRSFLKKILYILSSLVILILLTGWIFFAFFFQETLNSVAIPKIKEATHESTDGKFTLSLDSIFYSSGTLLCNNFLLSRVAYDTSEHGLVIKQLTIDTVKFEGVSWWDLLWGNDLHFSSLRMTGPKLVLSNADSAASHPETVYIQKTKSTAEASDAPVISFDSIMISTMTVTLPKRTEKSVERVYRNIDVKLTDFLIDTKNLKPEFLFSKRVNFYVPSVSYSLADSLYSVEVRGIRGQLSDSLVTVDSFTYMPNYDEQAFADKHKYIQGRLEFKCAGIALRGINITKLMEGKGLYMKVCEAKSWGADYYGDRRKPHNPHPPDAVLPHTILSGITTPVLVDTIKLGNGFIRHRERAPGSVKPSLITFTNANVVARPFCSDTTHPLFSEPMHFSVNALFMGKGKLVGEVSYPIHQKAFDLHISATVGGFDLPVLNSYLVTNERKEVTDGRLLNSELRMDVKSGVGTTMVRPRYKDLNIKILADGVKEGRGIIEGLKTFIANNFILETENIDSEDEKALSVTTKRVAGKKEEFFEYIWLALRKSILEAIGY